MTRPLESWGPSFGEWVERSRRRSPLSVALMYYRFSLRLRASP